MGNTTERNYFTCTLGQAAGYQRGLDRNINDFIEQQANDHRDLPAVGFYYPHPHLEKPWGHTTFTFKELYQASCATAEHIRSCMHIPERETVALLCPSSDGFLMNWLGLMRLGHPVLLIAPQCSPSAVAHLCKQCGTSVLIFDEIYRTLAEAASEAATKLELQLRAQLLHLSGGPFTWDTHKLQPVKNARYFDIPDTEVAYLHHTSGTSTGIPKPIPQSHRAGCGVLPRLNGKDHPTFTTTPLYHGGIAESFRAWTSNAMIWIFPGRDVPITAANIIRCLESTKASRRETTRPAKYFSSVPYVLEMMLSDVDGLQYLRDMELVGVGGAALSNKLGDKLVKEGVNLVSRFGSAECGFLMSSHRDYGEDKEWHYLRQGEGIEYLRFEKRDEGLSELVILPGWPHIAKTNREDGSFATSDLFAPHPTIPNAWRYAARGDSQLTLVTGKKFDPAPLESAIAASSPLIQDVLVFGNGMPYPGALLFRSKEAEGVSQQEIVRSLADKIEDLNRESQSHARIPRNMLIPMPYAGVPLEKSSKGTVLRDNAEKRYAAEIDNAYGTVSSNLNNVPDDEVERTILETVQSIMEPGSQGRAKLAPETDLFAFGVDSVACVQIRHAASRLLPRGSTALPMTVVQDAGTVQQLSQRILDIRLGKEHSGAETDGDQHQLMEELVAEYGQVLPSTSQQNPITPPRSPKHENEKVVLLTGPTGSIGIHLLHQLLQSSSVKHVHLILRGATQEAARERVLKAFVSRKLAVTPAFHNRVSIHTCKLSDDRLGLSEGTYNLLARDVDVIYHLAWSVDFLLPLKGFRQHFAGLQSLLNLWTTRSSSSPCKFVFCSSVASVASSKDIYPGIQAIPEQLITDPKVSGPIGYSKSKWVAENICLRAAGPHSDISVVRVGQVSGDTVHGIWNKSEAYPLMLASAAVTDCLPNLPDESLDWIPVDVAAKAFVDLLENNRKGSETNTQAINVLNVLNNDRTVTWRQLLNWIQKDANVEIVSVDEWLAGLERLKLSDDSWKNEHPSMKLLEFWKKSYGGKDGIDQPAAMTGPPYEMSASKEAMPTMDGTITVTEDYALKLWKWSKANI